MSGSGRRSAASEMLVVPAALLVVVVLSIFVLFSYRNTVETLVAERRREAETMARSLAREFEGRALPRDDELAARRGPARAVALLDAAGVPLVVSGEYAGAPPSGGELSWWKALAVPSRGVVSGSARFPSGGRAFTFQVDLGAGALNGAARGLEILVPAVLGVDSALLLLAGLFLYRYLAPFDRLLRRARESGRMPAASDELDFLVATFEETLEKLAAPPRDDLDALERTLAKSVESGLLLLDEAGDVLALNEIGAALLGVEPPPPGTGLADLLAGHPEPREALLEAVRHHRRLERRELELAGGDRTLGLTLHPLRRDDGRVRGFLAFFVDLTAVRRRAEERQLADSLAHIGELSAGVAHEMRNSLATLRGYLTLIGRGGGEDDVSEYVEEIRRETDHLKRVVDDFLAFARPGSARMEKVDLERLLHRAAADPALAAMPVRFDNRLPPGRESPAVHGDAQLLERAFRNLLHNAAEAERGAGRQGPIEVSLEETADGGLEVAIRDRGPGLPAELRSRLFHPFASHRPGGVGLGLALTHRILRLHGAGVSLDDRDGGGAEARVRLRGAAESDASIASDASITSDASVTEGDDRG